MHCPVGGTPLPVEALDFQSLVDMAERGETPSDYDVTWSEHAELYCVASGCRYCGKELLGCVKPKGAFNWIDLRIQAGLELEFLEPCIPVLSLSFASYEKMMQCWGILQSGLAASMRVWWSKPCLAGSPRSDPSVYFDDGSDEYRAYIDSLLCKWRSKWSYGECTMLIVPRELYNPIKGRWTDQILVLEIRRLLGCLQEDWFAAVVGTLEWKSLAQCELVPVSKLELWLGERQRILDGCDWEDFTVRNDGQDDMGSFHPLDGSYVVC